VIKSLGVIFLYLQLDDEASRLACGTIIGEELLGVEKHKRTDARRQSSGVVASLEPLTRVNSTNVLDEGLRIGGIGRRMNSKVKISQTRHASRINVVINLAHSQSVPDRPLLAPIYRRARTTSILGPSLMGLRGIQLMGSINYTLVNSPRDSTRIVDSG
jgi:hypothetical protein